MGLASADTFRDTVGEQTNLFPLLTLDEVAYPRDFIFVPI